jgi:hypothetical protein
MRRIASFLVMLELELGAPIVIVQQDVSGSNSASPAAAALATVQ